MKIFMSHVNAQAKVTLEGEIFNHHMHKMICPMGSGQPLSSAMPVTAQGLMNKVERMEDKHGLRNLDFLSLRRTWLYLLMNN